MPDAPREIWASDDGLWYGVVPDSPDEFEGARYVEGSRYDRAVAALKAAVAEWDCPAANLDKHAIHAMRAAIAEAGE